MKNCKDVQDLVAGQILLLKPEICSATSAGLSPMQWTALLWTVMAGMVVVETGEYAKFEGADISAQEQVVTKDAFWTTVGLHDTW